MRSSENIGPEHPLHLSIVEDEAGEALDRALYDGPDGAEQRQRESESFMSYGRAEEAERVYLRMVDNPTRHCAIRADGVMIHQPTAAGFVRVAPLPPLRGELGYRLPARSVITRDSPTAIADARWSLRPDAAPDDVRARAPGSDWRS